MSASTLLARLEGVRKAGNGWTAKCPSHADKTASLSIAETDDGKTLLHCFAGCGAIDVVGSLGLELSDLFPERARDYSPAGRVAAREAVTARERCDALAALVYASHVVQAAAATMLPWLFDQDDRETLGRAVDDIAAAVEVLA